MEEQQQPSVLARRLMTADSRGDLRFGDVHVVLQGRALRLILWIAGHQTRLNQTADESGQLWLTWKGDGPHSIDGNIQTRL